MAWVHRVRNSININVGVNHYRKHLHSQVILVGLNILAFNNLSDLFLKPLLIPCDLQIGVLALVKIGGSEALTLVEAYPAVNLRGVVALVFALIVHGIIITQHLFPDEVFQSSVNDVVLLTWVAVVASLLNKGYQEILWHQTNNLTVHIEYWKSMMW